MAIAEDLNSLCRLCMQSVTPDDTTNIFEDQENSYSIKIMNLGVEVSFPPNFSFKNVMLKGL